MVVSFPQHHENIGVLYSKTGAGRGGKKTVAINIALNFSTGYMAIAVKVIIVNDMRMSV